MNNLNGIPQFPQFVYYLLFVWALFWKGLALWRASKYSQKIWFVAILILNTVGILELIYLFGFAKNKLTLTELKSLFKFS